MHLDLWTMALQTVNVLVLVWLLQHFLFRPVAGIIAARRAAADRLLADAEAACAKAAMGQSPNVSFPSIGNNFAGSDMLSFE